MALTTEQSSDELQRATRDVLVAQEIATITAENDRLVKELAALTHKKDVVIATQQHKIRDLEATVKAQREDIAKVKTLLSGLVLNDIGQALGILKQAG